MGARICKQVTWSLFFLINVNSKLTVSLAISPNISILCGKKKGLELAVTQLIDAKSRIQDFDDKSVMLIKQG